MKYEFTRDCVIDCLPFQVEEGGKSVTKTKRSYRAGQVADEKDFAGGSLECCQRLGHVREFVPPAPEPKQKTKPDPEADDTAADEAKTPKTKAGK